MKFIRNLCNQEYEIPEDTYNDLKGAKELLSKVLSSERVFGMLVDNYIELEKEIFNQALIESLNPEKDSLDEPIYEINRRIINFLTTCRLFSDLSCNLFSREINSGQEACSIYDKNSEQSKRFFSRFCEERNNQEFRVVTALRNYAQHTDIPFQYLTLSSGRVESDGIGFWKNTVSAKIDIKELISKYDSLPKKQKNKNDRDSFDELERMGDYIEVIPLLRKCMDSMGRIISEIREIVEVDILSLESKVRGVINEYGDTFYLVSRNQSSQTEVILFSPEFMLSRRLSLVSKNENCTGYSRKFISTECPKT